MRNKIFSHWRRALLLGFCAFAVAAALHIPTAGAQERLSLSGLQTQIDQLEEEVAALASTDTGERFKGYAGVGVGGLFSADHVITVPPGKKLVITDITARITDKGGTTTGTVGIQEGFTEDCEFPLRAALLPQLWVAPQETVSLHLTTGFEFPEGFIVCASGGGFQTSVPQTFIQVVLSGFFEDL